jgi:hypothetical protein
MRAGGCNGSAAPKTLACRRRSWRHDRSRPLVRMDRATEHGGGGRSRQGLLDHPSPAPSRTANSQPNRGKHRAGGRRSRKRGEPRDPRPGPQVRRQQPPGGDDHPPIRRRPPDLARPRRHRQHPGRRSSAAGRRPTRPATSAATPPPPCASSPTTSSAPGSRSKAPQRSCPCRTPWTG